MLKNLYNVMGYKLFVGSLALGLVNCKSMHYQQSQRYNSDIYAELPEKRELVQTPLSYPEKQKWEMRLKKIEPLKHTDPFRYNMEAAHCYRNLGKYGLAAKHYQAAAEIQTQKKLKKKAQKNTIYSLADQGLLYELRGEYRAALESYEECNRYCKLWGFGQHIPHTKIQHLKLKKLKRRTP